jgi:PAS domain S-box-containing protein
VVGEYEAGTRDVIMDPTVLTIESTRARDLAQRAYLDVALDAVIVADEEGRIVEFNPAAERIFGYARVDALGQTLAELIVPPSLRAQHSDAFARFVATGKGRLLGRRLEMTGMRADGSEFPVELALSRIARKPLLICGAVRDLSDMRRAESDLGRLAREQTGLRRVATLVAEEASPAQVFAAVAEEIQKALELPLIVMARYELGDTIVIIGSTGEGHPFRTGTRWPLDPGVSLLVRQTGRPARVEYETLPGTISEAARQAGFQAALGVPIVVGGAIWGAIAAVSTAEQPLPDDAEPRLVEFTELVATAISNAQARDDLRRLADEQAALRRVATLIAEESTPGEVFAAVAREVATALDVPVTAVVRYEHETARQVGSWGEENPFPIGTSWPLDNSSVSGLVWHTRQPARVDDYSEVPGEIASTLAREAGIRTALGVPILIEGSPWGVMMALSTQERPLPDDVEERLLAFTELTATAISNAQARADVQRLADEQAALRRVAVLVARGASPEEVFAAVAEEVARLLDVPAISMVRFEPDETSTAIALWGKENPFSVGATFEPWPGVMLQVRRTGLPARLEDFAYSTGPTTARLQAARIHSGVGVPINVEGAAWGTIIALAPGGGSLPLGIEERLSSFTELVATAIANTEARDEVRQLGDEQAALRRVATLVAQGAEPGAVFSMVCEETGPLFSATSTNLAHFTADGFNLTMAGWSLHDTHVPTGTRLPLGGDTVNALVQRTAAPGRFDTYEGADGELAALLRARGIRAEVGAPVIVEGETWGALIAGWDTEEPPPAGIEHRLARFASLVATAIANAQARDDLRELAEEQAALRRVATLVAQEAAPEVVFATVAEEVAQVAGLPLVEIARFDADGTMTVLGAAGEHPFQTGTRWPLDNPAGSAAILQSAKPTRIEYTDDLPGEVAAAARAAGLRWALGVPIIVEGRVWGSIGAAPADGGELPADAEARLAGFTQLVATAISNATNSAQLLASRARIVAAADDARRRVERNLHDGTQQRLVALALSVQEMQANLASQPIAQSDLERIQDEIDSVIDEVRELSRGLHPGLLAQEGLSRALRALARKSPIPVTLDVRLDERPPESIEIAVYYVVSEALANAAKHAQASAISVYVEADDESLQATIEDNGVGRADAGRGTGLIGLIDRVEALGGRFALESPPSYGTRISIDLPLSTPHMSA